MKTLSSLSLRDALFLGFCAVLIVASRMAFRWHLGINGHSMFYTLFFLLLARGCVNYRWSSFISAFFAGLMAVLLGLGKGGPLILAKFILPALVIDLSAIVWPLFFTSYLGVAAVAATAASTKFFVTCFMDWLVGMDPLLMLEHALIEMFGAVVFAIAGSLFIPVVLRKLRARGVIS